MHTIISYERKHVASAQQPTQSTASQILLVVFMQHLIRDFSSFNLVFNLLIIDNSWKLCDGNHETLQAYLQDEKQNRVNTFECGIRWRIKFLSNSTTQTGKKASVVGTRNVVKMGKTQYSYTVYTPFPFVGPPDRISCFDTHRCLLLCVK